MPDDIARAEERCMERLKSKIQVLETSYDFDTARLEEKCERLQKQLDIAKEYLKWIIDSIEEGHICCDACGYPIECKGCENEEWAKDALKEIEELNK